MKRELSDEQLDNLMRIIVTDASADDAIIYEIADSPSVWWGVQRQINTQKNAVRSPWPPAPKLWRWLTIGVPAVAAVLLVAFFVLRPANMSGDQANNGAPTLSSENILTQPTATD